MPRNFGTLSLLDTLRVIDNQNIYEYGIDRLYDNSRILLTAHEQFLEDLTAEFVERTTDKIRRYGVPSDEFDFQESDEFGAADSQKGYIASSNVGFPLRNYRVAMGWSKKYWLKRSVSDWADQMTKLMLADTRNMVRAIRKGIYVPTNNLSYVDRLDDGITLPIRALLNADGEPIPPDPFGNGFNGATHTHYLATASLVSANVDSLVDTLTEHGLSAGETVRIVINRNDRTAFAALSGFRGYDEPLRQRGGGDTASVAQGGLVSEYDIDNMPIGLWNYQVEVWVKPWVPQNYITAYVRNGEGKLMVMRVDTYAGAGNLVSTDTHAHNPFESEEWEREFGIGIWMRHKAAVLYTGGGSYTAPTIS